MELKGPLGLRLIPATITAQPESGRSSRVAWQKFPDNLQHSLRKTAEINARGRFVGPATSSPIACTVLLRTGTRLLTIRDTLISNVVRFQVG